MNTPSPRSRRLAMLYAALLLVAVFGAGIAAGFWAGRSSSAGRTSPAEPSHAPPPPPGGLGPPELRRLNLTLEQQAQARAIGDRYHPELEALRRQIQPEAEKLHRKMRAELRKILTPEQRRLHDELERERMRRPPPPEGPAGPGGPGGPGGPAGPGRAPEEARRACEGLSTNAPCAFTLPTGAAINGVCLTPPGEPAPVCVPHEHLL